MTVLPTAKVEDVVSSNTAYFLVSAVPALSYIYPTSGPSFQQLLFVGDNFDHGSNYRVRCGDQMVTAYFVAGSCDTGNCRVRCTLPGGSVGTVISVELSINGQQVRRAACSCDPYGESLLQL